MDSCYSRIIDSGNERAISEDPVSEIDLILQFLIALPSGYASIVDRYNIEESFNISQVIKQIHEKELSLRQSGSFNTSPTVYPTVNSTSGIISSPNKPNWCPCHGFGHDEKDCFVIKSGQKWLASPKATWEAQNGIWKMTATHPSPPWKIPFSLIGAKLLANIDTPNEDHSKRPISSASLDTADKPIINIEDATKKVPN